MILSQINEIFESPGFQKEYENWLDELDQKGEEDARTAENREGRNPQGWQE